MRPLILSLALLLPLPAVADCGAEIAALFDGGAMDPFVRPNRREVTTIQQPGGEPAPHTDVLWDGVTRSINCTPHGCTMIVEKEAWMGGTTFDGPWTQAPTQMPDDPAVFARIARDDMAANIEEATCPGEIETDAGPRLTYRFRTQTNENEFGSWFGAFYEIEIDPVSGMLTRLTLSEEVASWAPEPAQDIKITTVTYDESISISPPEG